MEDQVAEEVKQDRQDKVMRQQQRIALEINRAMVGRTIPVLVERKLGKASWEGRTYGDAPDIDTIITLKGGGLSEGTITKARVSGFRGYDLVGEVAKS